MNQIHQKDSKISIGRRLFIVHKAAKTTRADFYPSLSVLKKDTEWDGYMEDEYNCWIRKAPFYRKNW